jgi:catechol 2,3-dioxygenase-like lactoylglutathione lyase family enzyme
MDTVDERPPLWTGHVVLYVRDTKAAADFWEKLGLRRVAATDTFAILEMRGGTHLAIRRSDEPAGGPAGWDLMVDDLDATHAAWSAAGVPVGELDRDPFHRIFTVTDADGNSVVVHDSHVVGPV